MIGPDDRRSSERVTDLYVGRSEYVTAGLICIMFGVVILIWIQVFSNYRRADVFTETQFLEGLTLTAIFCTVGLAVFLVRWIRGKP